MLDSAFIAILNMSITASFVAAVIIFIRVVLRNRLPKLFCYALWIILLIRLLVPFSFASKFSLFNFIPSPSAPPITQSAPIPSITGTQGYIPGDIGLMPQPEINSGIGIINNAINGSLPAATPQASANPMQIAMFFYALLWFAMAASLFAFHVVVYTRNVNRLKTAVLYKDVGLMAKCISKVKLKRKVRLFTSDRISTPVVCGLFKPRIILPLSIAQSLNTRTLQHIVTHELIHIKRFDYIIKPLWFLALCLHWFNPVVWISFILFQKDMEISCDERVMSVYHDDIRSEYATLLIKLTAKQNFLLNGGLLSFGESNIKSRIKSIMKYNKPGVWIITATITGLIVMGLLLLTNHTTSDIITTKTTGTPPKVGINDPGDKSGISTGNPPQSQVGQQNEKLYGEDKYWQINFATAIIGETTGKQGPGDDYKDIVKLPYGRLITISGRQMGGVSNGEWFLASLIPEINEDGSLRESPENPQKFWVRYDAIQPLTQKTISFDDNFPVTDIAGYNYVVMGDSSKEGKILMRQMPDEKSPYAALMWDGNLISVIQRDKEWSLVRKFNASAMEETTRVGWIKNDSYRQYTSGMKVTQGFVLRSAKMYENPDPASRQYPSEHLKSAILPVNILKSQNGWTYISSGFNGLALWVASNEVKYSFTSEELLRIAYPNVDVPKLANGIKESIKKWENIELRAEDTGKKIVLTSAQKTTLAEKFTAINDLEIFDGGFLPGREAYYPFYRLALKADAGVDIPAGIEFPSGVDLQLIVAGEDRLLLIVPSNKLGNYGMRQEEPSVRFIHVNKEFIDYMKSLLPTAPSNNVEDLNYLFNAKKVVINSAMNIAESATGIYIQQVNKCIRAIRSYIGKEWEPSAIDTESPEIATFNFVFHDGTQINVKLTKQYIQYGSKYYSISGTENPERIFMSLFAAYF